MKRQTSFFLYTFLASNLLISAPVWAQSSLQPLTSATMLRPDGRKIALGDLAFSYYQQAIKARQAGKLEQALKSLNEAVRVYPDYAQAYYERGGTHLLLKAYDQAVADFSKTIELKPKDLLVDAYNNRGFIYNEHLQQYEQAIQDFTRALQLNPAYARAAYNRGLAYDRSGKTVPAIQDYTRTLELEPDYVDAYNNRGIVYLESKQYDKALADFNKAIALKPDYPLGFYNLGLIYAYQNKHTQALEHYTQAIKLNPRYVEAYHNRGFIYNDILKEYGKALADFDKALELNPDYINAYYNRGLTYYNQNQFAKAIADFAQVIQRNAKDADAFYYRGESHYQLSEFDKAIADFEQVIGLIPDDAWGHYWLARLYSLKRDRPKALNFLRTAIQYNPEFKDSAPEEPALVFLREMPEFKKLIK